MTFAGLTGVVIDAPDMPVLDGAGEVGSDLGCLSLKLIGISAGLIKGWCMRRARSATKSDAGIAGAYAFRLRRCLGRGIASIEPTRGKRTK